MKDSFAMQIIAALLYINGSLNKEKPLIYIPFYLAGIIISIVSVLHGMT